MKRIVDSGETPGIMAYDRGAAVGWCSIAPREVFTVLERSRVAKPVDDKPVWSITCLFVAASHRRTGVGVELLKAAVNFAAKQGATIVEGYPIEPKTDPMPAPFAWLGLAEQFKRAGFTEVLRRSETRPIMRATISRGRQ
jgi:GNAT superfamily N-acetyltransferase